MKKLWRMLIVTLVLVSLSVFVYSIKNAAFAWGSNDDFLDSSFRATNPTNTGIIEALYGDGDIGADTTAYTNHWTGGGGATLTGTVTGCNVSNMSVVYLNSGLDTIPERLATGTIYVLSGGLYTVDYPGKSNGGGDKGSISMGNCSAIVGKGESTIRMLDNITATTVIMIDRRSHTILDNINIDGRPVNAGTPTSGGIVIFVTKNSTLHNVNSFYNGLKQIYLRTVYNVIINDGKFYNTGPTSNVPMGIWLSQTYDSIIKNVDISNVPVGMLLQTGRDNVIDHVKVYDVTIGLWLRYPQTHHNLVKNSQFYNASFYGVILTEDAHHNDFSNIQAFNNIYAGIYFRAGNNNTGSTGTFLYSGSIQFPNSDRAEYNTITNSQFYNNLYGIALFGADHTIINRTRVYNNAIGLGIINSQDNILNDFGIANNKYGILTTTGSTNNTWYGSMRSNPNTTKYCYTTGVNFVSPAGSIACAVSTPLGAAGHAGILTPGSVGNKPSGWANAGILNVSFSMICSYGTDTINASGSRFHPTTSCNTISTGLMFSRAPTQPVGLNGNVMGGAFLRQISYIYHFVGSTITAFYPEYSTCAMVGDPDFISKCGSNTSRQNTKVASLDLLGAPNNPGAIYITGIQANVIYEAITGDSAYVDFNTLNSVFETLAVEGINPVDIDHVSIYLQNFDTNSSATISDFFFLGINRGSIIIPASSELKVTIHIADGSPVEELGLVIGEDLIHPTIALEGESTIVLPLKSSYTDQGATANDDIDGSITSNIVTNNPVDTTIAGTYTVTYDVSDAAGNKAAQVTRTVIITP